MALLSVITENKPGMIATICTVFTRRRINIDSFNSFRYGAENLQQHLIAIDCTQEEARKVVLQIEKKIDVLKVNCFTDWNENISYLPMNISKKIKQNQLINK